MRCGFQLQIRLDELPSGKSQELDLFKNSPNANSQPGLKIIKIWRVLESRLKLSRLGKLHLGYFIKYDPSSSTKKYCPNQVTFRNTLDETSPGRLLVDFFLGNLDLKGNEHIF